MITTLLATVQTTSLNLNSLNKKKNKPEEFGQFVMPENFVNWHADKKEEAGENDVAQKHDVLKNSSARK